MNKILLVFLLFCGYNLLAQDQINFKTIDIIKSEDSNPNSFALLSNKIYFFANDGKNFNDYSIWNFNKDSNVIEQSKFGVKGNQNKVSFFGNINDVIYYLDTNTYNDIKLYLISELNGEQVILSKISDFEIIQKQTDFLIIFYKKDNKQHIAKVTSNGLEELITSEDKILENGLVVSDNIFFISMSFILKFNINSKIKTEIKLPNNLELNRYTPKNNLINYFNGFIYYPALNYTNGDKKLVKFNIKSNNFEVVNIPETSLKGFYSMKEFALIHVDDKFYKINDSNLFTKYDALSSNAILNSKLINNRLFLNVYSFINNSSELIEIKNDGIDKHDYEVNLNTVIYDENKFLFIKNNGKLFSYNIDSKNKTILNDANILVHDILGVDENRIYLNASTSQTGKEFYVYNKKTNKIDFFGDINSGPGTNPKSFYNVGNKVFYDGNYKGYSHLFVSNGTLDGTKVLRPDINLTLNNNSSAKSLDGLEFNGKLLFGGDKGNKSGHELWVSDGTDEGTFEIEINPNNIGSHSEISGFRGFIGKTPTKVYFKGYLPDKGEQIWVTDGTKYGTRMVKYFDIIPNRNDFSILKNIILDEKLYFVKIETKDHNYRSDLWVTDGTENGTKKITELTEFWNWHSHYYVPLIEINDKYLYYSKYYNAPYGQELMSGDYIHRLNLLTLKEERLYKYHFYNVDKEYIYITQYIDNQYKLVKFNKSTDEGKTILENVSSDFKHIVSCGNYSIIANSRYSDSMDNMFFYNNTNDKIVEIFKDKYKYAFKNNVICVNDNFLINYSKTLNKENLKLISIKNDELVEYPVKIDNVDYLDYSLSKEMNYNHQLHKIFINPIVDSNSELAVANFGIDDSEENPSEENPSEEVVIDKPKINSLIIYPNPAGNIVNLQDLSNIQSVYLFDFTGKIIKEFHNINKKEFQFNISGITKGNYIINVISENKKTSKKLIIK